MFYRLIIAIGFLLLITGRVQSQNQILINEIISSSNQSTFDEDNESSDWIELYNNTSSKLNLIGYRISDKNDFSGAWSIPEISINSGSSQLIFASGKNRRNSNNYIIEASGEGINQYEYDDGFRFQYRKLEGDFDIQMRVHSVRDAGNACSAGLIMRESLDERSKFAGVICYYQDNYNFIFRNQEGTYPVSSSPTFKLEYPNGWVRLKRQGDSIYGYAKDLGGHWSVIKVYYYPAPGSMFVGIVVASAEDDKLAKAAISDLMLNNIPLNADTLETAEINTEINGKSYFSSELHTNFKLSSDGETLYLWNPDKELIDSMSFPALTSDVSYGRYPDGSNDREFFSYSTPGKSNQKGLSGYAEEPVFNIAAGWYDSGLLLKFENNNPGLQIRFTTDGTEVSDTSALYDDNNIVIDSSTVIRAKSYKADLLPSKEIVNTYILIDSSSLPTVSFAISPKLLWDTVSGIFNNHNIWPAPEIGGNFEIFNIQKKRVFSSHTGLSVHGGNSRTYEQKSLKLVARGKYESSTFAYQFFGNNYLDEYNGIIFRNSGIDWRDTKLRDAFCSVISEQIPTQRMAKYIPYISFLNGRYWGIYDLREKLDEFYLSKNYNIPAESINLIDQDEFIMYGRIDEYDEMKSKIFSSDMSKTESYNTIDSLIDIENLIDYLSLEIYCNNMDWPWNNVKVWNSAKYDGKWRWMLHDLDWTFGYMGAPAYYNVMKDALKSDTSKFTRLFLKILENNQVRIRFINKFADLMNSVFLNYRLKKILDSLANIIEPEMKRFYLKWGGVNETYQRWQGHLSNMRIFIDQRAVSQRDHIIKFYNLEGDSKVTLDVNNKGSGVVKINTLNITAFPWEGYYFNKIPVPIQAIPGSGYKFTGWRTSIPLTDSTMPEQIINLTGDTKITAIFDKIYDNDTNIVINEIMYNPSDSLDSEDWVELYNPSSINVDISNWKLTDNEPGHVFLFPTGTIMLGKTYLVVSRDTTKFNNVYTNIEPLKGNFDFGLGNPDQVRLINVESETIDSVFFFSSSPWPGDCDGTGKSMELTNPMFNNVLGENWQSSKNNLGTPGRENSVYLSTQYPDIDYTSLNCFPNPFVDKLKIHIIINDTQKSKIEIFNLYGKKVKSILDNKYISGINEFIWNGCDDTGVMVDDGMYYCVFTGNKSMIVFKLIKLNYKGETK